METQPSVLGDGYRYPTEFMTPDQARIEFREFAGDRVFKRFAYQLLSDAKNRRDRDPRLRFWQQEVWAAFCDAANLRDTSHDFICSSVLWCIVHDRAFEQCDAPTIRTKRCGRSRNHNDEQHQRLRDAHEMQFPFGLGGHGLNCAACALACHHWLEHEGIDHQHSNVV